jgi:arylsulfatase A-like enzyme
MLRYKKTILVLLILLSIGLLIKNYWMALPGIIDGIKNPIHDYHEAVWNTPDASQKSNLPVNKRPPNIIVIMADDLGYNDITLNGGGVAGGVVPTPAIDSIAKDGVNLRSGYAGNATCAPSRASLMTGKYPTRFGFEFTPTPSQFGKAVVYLANHNRNKEVPPAIYHDELESTYPDHLNMSVPTSEIMLPKSLKDKNYHNLFIGKWHLGGTPSSRPEARGFDEVLGFMAATSMYLKESDPRAVNAKQDFDPIDPFLWANLPFAVDQGKERFQPNEYMSDYLGKEASRAIAVNKDRPFFMYLAFSAPHSPLQALKSDYDSLPQIKDHPLRVYASMIKALDRNVGRVLDTLKKNGLEDNTLIIFTSDNGGANYIGLDGINSPYRGWKATFFDGGIHVPFFMKWPNQIPKGTRYDAPVSHVDIFATAAAAGGVNLNPDNGLDGVNLVPYVRGKKGNPHKNLFWRNGQNLILLQDGWKLQIANHNEKIWLFNIENDPGERNNLSEKYPQKVAELKEVLMQINSQQKPPLWNSLWEVPVVLDHSMRTPIKKDEEYFYFAN